MKGEILMQIDILGEGEDLERLKKNVKKVLEKLPYIEYKLSTIKNIATIDSYGIPRTPALVINGRVVYFGYVLSIEELKTLLHVEYYKSLKEKTDC